MLQNIYLMKFMDFKNAYIAYNYFLSKKRGIRMKHTLHETQCSTIKTFKSKAKKISWLIRSQRFRSKLRNFIIKFCATI